MQKLTLSLLCAGFITTTAIAEDICYGAYQAQNYNQAAACYVKQLKKERTFNNLWGAGVSYSKQGQYKEALSYLKDAEKKAITPEDYSSIYSWLNVSYDAVGNLEQSLAYAMKGLNLNLKSGNNKKIGGSYSSLGVCYSKQNQPQKALEYHEKALEYQEDTERAATYNNIAYLYGFRLNDLVKAEEMYLMAISIDEKIGDLHDLSSHKTSLAYFYFNNNRDSDAHRTISEALNISRQAHIIDDESHALTLLAIFDHRNGRIAEAKAKASEALRLAKQSGTQGVVLADAQYAWNLVNEK